MTDDEALTILHEADYMDWDTYEDRPYWRQFYQDMPALTLKGSFTVKELQAILHFSPKEGL